MTTQTGPVVIQHRTMSIRPCDAATLSKEIADIEHAVNGYVVEICSRADRESGVEETLRTHAALMNCQPQMTWVDFISGHGDALILHLGDENQSRTPPESALRYGAGRNTVRGSRAEAEAAVFDYWTIESVASAMGRKFRVAGFDPDDGSTSVDEAVGEILGEFCWSSPEFFIKPTRSKAMVAEPAWIDQQGLLTSRSEA